MRERGTGRLFQRGTTWWIQFYQHGQQIRESAKTENEKKATNLLRKRMGAVVNDIQLDTRGLRYEDLREAYFLDYQINGHKSLRRDGEGKLYLDKVNRLDDYFAGFRAVEIDTESIKDFIQKEQKRGMANGSINRSVAALRRMFNLAREENKIRNVPYFPMLKEAAPRKGFFEKEQYQSLSAALPDYLRLPLAIGYFTGMRLEEILSLKWDQVDFLTNTINLLAGTTKNDEARTIPVIPQLLALLLARRAQRQPDCHYVCFRLDRKGHADRIGSFRKVWQSRCVKVGLGKMEPAVDRVTGGQLYAPPRGPRSKPKAKMVYRGMIFHDLRRSSVRAMVRAGVPEKVAMAISGHKTRSVFERYNIVSGKDVFEAGSQLAAFHEVGDNSGTITRAATQGSSLTN